MNPSVEDLQSELETLRRELRETREAWCQSQGQLDRERARFQSVFEGMGEGLLITDLHDRIEYANAKMTDICGYGRDEMIGRPAYEVFLPREEWPRLDQRNERRAQGFSDSYETLLQHKNGERIWVLIHATPLRDERGQVVGTIGAQIEITKRKQAEFALRQSEERLRSVVEHAVDGFIVHDFDGNLLEVNAQICQSLGFSREQMLGKNVRDFEMNFEGDAVQFKWDCLRDGGRATVHGRQKRSDGTAIPVEVRVGRVEWNGSPALLALVRDVSEREEMERALREALSERQLIMETVPDVLFRLDLEGHLVSWNRKLEEVTQLAPGELQGRHALDFFALPDKKPVADAIVRSLSEGFSSVEAPLLHLDGSSTPFSFSSVPLLDEDGSVLGLTGTGRDISERLRVEEQTRLALREKEVLLKEIHHRVKNNLQIINSLLSMQADALGDARVKAAFAESQGRIRAMALIHETLYLAGDLGCIDVRAYVTRLTGALLRGYGETTSGVDVELHIENNLLLPLDNAVPCGLIINELVTNSFKYAFPQDATAQGEKKRGRRGTISVGVERAQNARWTFRVGDNGRGMPDIDLAQVTSTGLQLVTGLCDQLEAEFFVDRTGGTQWTISFISS